MFLSIDDLLNKGVKTPISITEFYPYTRKAGIVPASKLAFRPMQAFGDTSFNGLSLDKTPEELLFTEENYINKLTDFLDDLEDRSDIKIELYFSPKELYRRYLNVSNHLFIAGVVSIVEDSPKLESSLTVPMFTPPDGLRTKLDLESYWKSVMLMLPNIVPDASTVIRMHGNYIKDNNLEDLPFESSNMILKTKDLKDLLSTINEALEETDVSKVDMLNMISDGVIENQRSMKEYYKYMMVEFDVSTSQATGLLLYSFDQSHKRAYSNADIELMYNSDSKLIVSLVPERKNVAGARTASII